MRTLLAVALLCPFLAVAATRTEARKVGDFAAIDAAGGLTLEVKRGPTALSLEGEPEAIAAYTTEVKDGVLVIRRKKSARGELPWGSTVTVRVTTPALEKLVAGGGVDVSLADVATSAAFQVELSGGVKLRATGIRSEMVTFHASGGVEARLEGRALSASVEVSGGVNLDARALQLSIAKIEANGGCDVKLNASKSVKGTVSGGVSLDVYGNPPELRVDASGAATVDRVN